MNLQEAWQRVEPLTDSLYRDAAVLWEAAQKMPPGEIWECGVWRGGSALLLKLAYDGAYPMRLFDTFTGFPDHGPEDTRVLEEPFRSDTSPELVLEAVGPGVFIYKGLIPKTFEGLEDKRIGLLHVDLDLYAGTLATLHFCWPRMVPGAVALIHDYFQPDWGGVNRAVDEFAKEHDLEVLGPHGRYAALMKEEKA